MRFLSLFSGIEAASVAWELLGWTCVGVAEIEPFPCAVLAHRFPEVPNLGDVSKIEIGPGATDVVVGGSPCQSFSVAGRRIGLDDPRGNLAIEYLRIVRGSRASWLVYENVPGLLSSGGGDDFAAFLSIASGRRVECPAGGWGDSGVVPQRSADDYGIAWRVLDAQYFGLAQQRQRLFAAGYLGDWRRAAAVLLERQSLSSDPPPCRIEGSDPAYSVTRRTRDAGERRVEWRRDIASALLNPGEGSRSDESLVAYAFAIRGRDDGAEIELGADIMNAIRSSPGCAYSSGVVVGRPDPLFYTHDYNQFRVYGVDGPSPALTVSDSNGGRNHLVGSVIRRLTPRERERLMGFPDDWTRIPWRGRPAEECPPGPRCKALGNSMAIPCVAWIGERIQRVESIPRGGKP